MEHDWKMESEEYGEAASKPDKPYSFGAQNLGSEYHTGPKCKRCGFEFCEHCNPEAIDTECGTASLSGDESKVVFRF